MTWVDMVNHLMELNTEKISREMFITEEEENSEKKSKKIINNISIMYIIYR